MNVHRLTDEYKLSFDIDGDWSKADVVVGSDILLGFDGKESINKYSKDKDTTMVEIIVSDN